MSEFIYCTRSYDAKDLQRKFNFDINQLCDTSCKTPGRVVSMVPYRLNGTVDRDNGSRTHAILTRSSARPIVEMSQAYGSENLGAMSELFANLQDQLGSEQSTAIIGATTDAYSGRAESFAKAVRQYQSALLQLGKELKAKSPNVAKARANAQNAYNYMHERFQAELSQLKFQGGSRGTPFSSFDRGVNIVKDSRIVRLRLDSTVQAQRLVQFTRYAKSLGNGLAVIDFGSRIGNIKTTFDGGGDWHREMFKESLSFGFSAWAGGTVTAAGLSALGFVLAATPVGWVGIVVLAAGGLAVMGAGATTAYYSNKFTKEIGSDFLYDLTLNWLNR